jgi:folate-binding protein YgfZ
VIPDLTGVVWVTGSDAVTFLDGLLSQNVAVMRAGETRPGLLLAPNGKLRAPLHILRYENRVGLACDAGRTDVVSSDLSRFKIRVDVEISVETRPVWDIWGVQAVDAVGDVPPGGIWTGDDQIVFGRPFSRSDLPRINVIGEAPSLERLTPGDIEATRIEVGEPIMGVDLTDKTIPQEGIEVAAAVDFTKGCYLGQELVARIESRGHVNRRLTGLVFEGSDLPPIQSDVLVEDKAVGTLTSAAWSFTLAKPVALGMIRFEATEGMSVQVGASSGTIAQLPLVP